MKNFFTLSLVLILVFSCSHDEEYPYSVNNTNNTEYDISLIISKFTHEYAFFENEEVLNVFLSELRKMKRNEKVELFDNLPYKTVSDKLKAFYSDMDEFREAQQFYDLVDNTNGLLEITENELGESEVLEPGLPEHSISQILNEDLIIKVGNTYHKYFNQYKIQSKNLNELSKISNIDQLSSSNLEHEVFYQVMAESSFDRDLNQIIPDELVVNEPWCVNDRRVRYTALINYYSGYHHIFPFANLIAIVKVRPAKKGIPCIWYNYTTRIISEDFRHEFNYTLTSEKFGHFDPVEIGSVRNSWIEEDFDGEENELLYEREFWRFQLTDQDFLLRVIDAKWITRHQNITTDDVMPEQLNIDFEL